MHLKWLPLREFGPGKPRSSSSKKIRTGRNRQNDPTRSRRFVLSRSVEMCDAHQTAARNDERKKLPNKEDFLSSFKLWQFRGGNESTQQLHKFKFMFVLLVLSPFNQCSFCAAPKSNAQKYFKGARHMADELST